MANTNDRPNNEPERRESDDRAGESRSGLNLNSVSERTPARSEEKSSGGISGYLSSVWNTSANIVGSFNPHANNEGLFAAVGNLAARPSETIRNAGTAISQKLGQAASGDAHALGELTATVAFGFVGGGATVGTARGATRAAIGETAAVERATISNVARFENVVQRVDTMLTSREPAGAGNLSRAPMASEFRVGNLAQPAQAPGAVAHAGTEARAAITAPARVEAPLPTVHLNEVGHLPAPAAQPLQAGRVGHIADPIESAPVVSRTGNTAHQGDVVAQPAQPLQQGARPAVTREPVAAGDPVVLDPPPVTAHPPRTTTPRGPEPADVLVPVEQKITPPRQAGVAPEPVGQPVGQPVAQPRIHEQGTPPVARQGERPVGQGEPPVVQGERPVGQGERPVVQGERPVVQGERPVVQGERPVAQGERPVAQGERPVAQSQPSGAGEGNRVVPHTPGEPLTPPVERVGGPVVRDAAPTAVQAETRQAIQQAGRNAIVESPTAQANITRVSESLSRIQSHILESGGHIVDRTAAAAANGATRTFPTAVREAIQTVARAIDEHIMPLVRREAPRAERAAGAAEQPTARALQNVSTEIQKLERAIKESPAGTVPAAVRQELNELKQSVASIAKEQTAAEAGAANRTLQTELQRLDTTPGATSQPLRQAVQDFTQLSERVAAGAPNQRELFVAAERLQTELATASPQAGQVLRPLVREVAETSERAGVAVRAETHAAPLRFEPAVEAPVVQAPAQGTSAAQRVASVTERDGAAVQPRVTELPAAPQAARVATPEPVRVAARETQVVAEARTNLDQAVTRLRTTEPTVAPAAEAFERQLTRTSANPTAAEMQQLQQSYTRLLEQTRTAAPAAVADLERSYATTAHALTEQAVQQTTSRVAALIERAEPMVAAEAAPIVARPATAVIREAETTGGMSGGLARQLDTEFTALARDVREFGAPTASGAREFTPVAARIERIERILQEAPDTAIYRGVRTELQETVANVRTQATRIAAEDAGAAANITRQAATSEVRTALASSEGAVARAPRLADEVDRASTALSSAHTPEALQAARTTMTQTTQRVMQEVAELPPATVTRIRQALDETTRVSEQAAVRRMDVARVEASAVASDARAAVRTTLQETLPPAARPLATQIDESAARLARARTPEELTAARAEFATARQAVVQEVERTAPGAVRRVEDALERASVTGETSAVREMHVVRNEAEAAAVRAQQEVRTTVDRALAPAERPAGAGERQAGAGERPAATGPHASEPTPAQNLIRQFEEASGRVASAQGEEAAAAARAQLARVRNEIVAEVERTNPSAVRNVERALDDAIASQQRLAAAENGLSRVRPIEAERIPAGPAGSRTPVEPVLERPPVHERGPVAERPAVRENAAPANDPPASPRRPAAPEPVGEPPVTARRPAGPEPIVETPGAPPRRPHNADPAPVPETGGSTQPPTRPLERGPEPTPLQGRVEVQRPALPPQVQAASERVAATVADMRAATTPAELRQLAREFRQAANQYNQEVRNAGLNQTAPRVDVRATVQSAREQMAIQRQAEATTLRSQLPMELRPAADRVLYAGTAKEFASTLRDFGRALEQYAQRNMQSNVAVPASIVTDARNFARAAQESLVGRVASQSAFADSEIGRLLRTTAYTTGLAGAVYVDLKLIDQVLRLPAPSAAESAAMPRSATGNTDVLPVSTQRAAAETTRQAAPLDRTAAPVERAAAPIERASAQLDRTAVAGERGNVPDRGITLSAVSNQVTFHRPNYSAFSGVLPMGATPFEIAAWNSNNGRAGVTYIAGPIGVPSINPTDTPAPRLAPSMPLSRMPFTESNGDRERIFVDKFAPNGQRMGVDNIRRINVSMENPYVARGIGALNRSGASGSAGGSQQGGRMATGHPYLHAAADRLSKGGTSSGAEASERLNPDQTAGGLATQQPSGPNAGAAAQLAANADPQTQAAKRDEKKGENISLAGLV